MSQNNQYYQNKQYYQSIGISHFNHGADIVPLEEMRELPSRPSPVRRISLVSLLVAVVTLGYVMASRNGNHNNYAVSLLRAPAFSNRPDILEESDGVMKWYNPPSDFAHAEDGEISFKVPGHTDYWRITFHGFIKDDGPFYYRKVAGDFEVTAKFSGKYASLYDQAGLMVRESNLVWMKCGVEFTDGIQHASTVITRDFSDWSILPIPSNPKTIWFKARRTKECIETFYSLDGVNYTQIRQAYLSTAKVLDVGVVAAAPRGDGFDVVFESFDVAQK